MKNNRNFQLDPEILKAHNLSTDPPPKDSLFWRMWNSCTGIADKALNTKFVQGIKNGTLDPTLYGGFNVSDAYYCYHGAADYKVAVDKAKDPVLKAFLTQKYNSYKKYNDTFPETWHIKSAESVVPSSVCKAYSDFETSTIAKEDPIYALIVMLPCSYLWAWLGATLSPPNKGNLYADWITGNNYPHGPHAMGNFIVDYQKVYPLDEKKAMMIYQEAMTYEWKNFVAAVPKKKT